MYISRYPPSSHQAQQQIKLKIAIVSWSPVAARPITWVPMHYMHITTSKGPANHVSWCVWGSPLPLFQGWLIAGRKARLPLACVSWRNPSRGTVCLVTWLMGPPGLSAHSRNIGQQNNWKWLQNIIKSDPWLAVVGLNKWRSRPPGDAATTHPPIGLHQPGKWKESHEKEKGK